MGKRRADDSASYGVFLFGGFLIVVGAFTVSVGLGLIALGACALYAGWELSA